jgi:hypothetical protein
VKSNSNKAEVSRLAAFVEDAFGKARDARSSVESRWTTFYYNSLGQFAPDVQGTWVSGERDQAGENDGIFYGLTPEKIRAAMAQMDDVAQSIGETLTLEADELGRQEQEIGKVAKFLRGVKGVLGMEVPEIPNDAESVENALKVRQAQYREWMAHDDVDQKYRGMIFDATVFGSGILRCPVTSRKERLVRVRGVLARDTVEFPGTMNVSPWDFYPAPDATSIESADYVIVRHRLTSSQFWREGKRLGWDRSAMDRLTDAGAICGDGAEGWETQIRSGKNETETEGGKIYVLEYWGECRVGDIRDQYQAIQLDAAKAVSYGGKSEETLSDNDYVCVCVTVCGGEVLKADLNPWYPLPYKPFLKFDWDLKNGSFWGRGLAESIADKQRLANGALRLLIRGKAFGNVPMMNVYADRAIEGQDLTTIFPGKTWITKTGQEGAVIEPVVLADNTNGLVEMLNLMKALADEESGVNQQTSGLDAPDNAKTATGQAIINRNMNRVIKSRLNRMDDVVEDHGDRLDDWYLRFDERNDTKVPVKIRAVGVRSAMVREMRAAQLTNFLGMVAGPLSQLPLDALDQTLAGRIDLKKLLTEIADALEVENLVKRDDDGSDPEAVAAKLILPQLLGGVEGGIGPMQNANGPMPGGGFGAAPGAGAMPGMGGEPGIMAGGDGRRGEVQ